LNDDAAASVWTKIVGEDTEPTETALNTLVANGQAGFRLTRLAKYIYETRPDVQRHFPDPCGRDGPKFLLWILTYGRQECQLSETYLRPLREQWKLLLKGLDNPLAKLWYRFVMVGASVYVRGRTSLTRKMDRVRTAGLRWRYRRWMKGSERRQPLSGDVPNDGPFREMSRFLRENPGDVGFNVIGYVKSEMGVGESARCAVRAAESQDIGVRVVSLRSTGPHEEGSYVFRESGEHGLSRSTSSL